MQRKIYTGLILILFLNLLVKPFYILGVDAEIQNRVGETAYGNYFALLNLTFLFNILLDLGISNYNSRNISQNPELLKEQFGKILALRVFLFLVYCVVTFFFAIIFGYESTDFKLLFVLTVNQFLIALIQYSRSNFGALYKFKTDAFISILDRILLIIFCSILLWTDWLNIEISIFNFVIAQLCAYALTAFISFVFIARYSKPITFKFDQLFSFELVKKTFPYALLILLMMAYNRMDAVMLERLLPDGDFQAGIYAKGYRYLDAVNMFALLFAGVLLPVFSKELKLKSLLNPMINLSLRLLISTAIFVALIGWFYKTELLNLRYLSPTSETINTFGILILSFIPVSLTYIFGTLLTAAGELRKLNFMALAGLILNLILNFVLIPIWKAEGAAIATLITQLLTALAQIYLAKNYFNFSSLKATLFKQIIFTTSLIILVFFLASFENKFLLNFAILSVTTILLFFILGFIKFSELKNLLKKN